MAESAAVAEAAGDVGAAEVAFAEAVELTLGGVAAEGGALPVEGGTEGGADPLTAARGAFGADLSALLLGGEGPGEREAVPAEAEAAGAVEVVGEAGSVRAGASQGAEGGEAQEAGEREKGGEGEEQREEGERGERGASALRDHALLVEQVGGMPQWERVAFLQSLGEFREAVVDAGSTAARDFAETVGLDLGQVPAEAFQEAAAGKPERLRDAIIQHSRHIQAAIRTANEAGRRASRDQLRAANPLPPAGDRARAATALPATYEDAQVSFARAMEGMGA